VEFVDYCHAQPASVGISLSFYHAQNESKIKLFYREPSAHLQ